MIYLNQFRKRSIIYTVKLAFFKEGKKSILTAKLSSFIHITAFI
ncbi:hypothetical protein [Orientia tsutsugamushi]|nr:hypothetical protein [Orientia tsutsugamushi]